MLTPCLTDGIILTMSTLFDRLTDEQVRIILDGVKNDVDYDIIARNAGLSHKKRVSEFLLYRMVHQFNTVKNDRTAEIASPPGDVLD